ncbi:MAG TPA: RodZ domain-containing protein [Gaiellaceae bacterium]
MFEIGPSLKEARIRRGLSPADVHKAIRIRERYLTALEEERWELLPGDAYTKGFLRTYAEYLGLNGQLYIDEYNGRIAQHDEEPLVPEALKGRRGGGILFRTIGALLVIGGAVGGLVAWHHAGAPSRPTVETAAAAPAVVPPAAPAKQAAKPVLAPKPTATTIAAVRDTSWLSVRIGGPSGREIFRGTLQRGRSLTFGLARPIWVRMGRPQALDIRIGKTRVAGLPGNPANLVLTKTGPRR